MQTELVYELYDACMTAIEDRNRARERAEELQNRASVYAEKLDLFLTDSVREELSDDITSRMDFLIKMVMRGLI